MHIKIDELLCVHVAGRSIEEFLKELDIAQNSSSFVELRVDYIDKLDNTHLELIKSKLHVRGILTCRSRSNGGHYWSTERNRIKILCLASELKFPLVDIEMSMVKKYPQILSFVRNQTSVIISHHDFSKTPSLSTLLSIQKEMRTLSPSLWKIATMIRSEAHSKSLLQLALRTTFNTRDGIIIGMGVMGRIVRFLAPLLGSQIAYSCLPGSVFSVPGGISKQTLKRFLDSYEWPDNPTGNEISFPAKSLHES